MRPLWPSFVFLLLKETESTAPGGTPTTVAAPNFSSLSPREEVTASVKPIPVQLQDESEGKTGDKQEGKEERVGPSQISSVVERATPVGYGWNGWLSVPLDFPIDKSKFSKICKETNIVTEKQLKEWLTKFHMPDQSFRGDDLVTGLIRGGRGEELVQLFHQMWGIPELKKRAAMMQRALLAEEPKLLPSVFNMWLGSKVTPAEAYHMMPISTKKGPLVAVNKDSSPTVIFWELRHWLVYVRDYQLKWYDFRHDQAIDMLVRAGLSEEQLVQVFQRLRGTAGITTLVDAFQKCLVVRSQFPLETLKLMFNAWLDSKVDPIEVYRMMPIPAQKRLTGPIEKLQSLDVTYPMLTLWIDYVYKFPFKNPSPRDDLVVNMLVGEGLPEVELVSFFNWLRRRPELKKTADLLQKKLALKSPNPAKTFELLIDAWKTDVSLEDAYHMMPISSEKSSWVAAEEEPSTAASYQMLELWIDYGSKSLSASTSPWDDRVIKVLVGEGLPEVELVNFFNWLRGRPDMKKTADLLQKKLALRSMAPLETLQLMFSVWRKSNVDLEDAYLMIPISAERNFRDVVASTSSWRASFPRLELWIEYAFESGNLNPDYGRVIAVLLADKRSVEDLVSFFNWLRGRPNMKKTADLLQKKLALKVPTSNTLKLMIHAWTDAGISPDEVYYLIPSSAEKSYLDALAVEPGLPTSFMSRELWIGYVVLYRNKGKDFSDDQVINVLVGDGLSEVELVSFFNWLRRRPKLKETADLLQKKLALKSPNPAKTFELLIDAWKTDVSLEDAYHMMPIPAAKSSVRAAGEKSIWLTNYNVLQHWVRYASKSKSKVNDDQVIKMMVADNMNTQETIQIFRRLRQAYKLRAYVNTLEGILIARQSESEKMLDKRIDAWLEQRVTPREAYPMIISAENCLTVADGEMSNVPAIFRIHKKWVKYVYMFRSGSGVFSDDQVIEVLLAHERPDFSVEKFLKWLQSDAGMKRRADMLLNKLPNPAVLPKTS